VPRIPLLTHDRYCDEGADQAHRSAAVVTSGADLTATVPTCPEWSLEDLVRHLGGALEVLGDRQLLRFSMTRAAFG
jgi:hypothetical protein